MMYSCRYYAVGFFIFAKLYNLGAWEPIWEVEDEQHGKEFILWLEQNPFVTQQLIEAANDNAGTLGINHYL